jgi:diguanylate cyclase (GGDEF)-like protein/PAS domain S-box-containing protein
MTRTSLAEHVPRKRPIQILYVEDEEADVELCLKALKIENLEFHCDPVRTLEGIAERLAERTYDVVLAGYHLKEGTGMDALALLRERRLGIPFILVSGYLGEEKAVDCIKNGVDDLILKDHLARLPLAICRVLEEKNVREAQERSELALRESEERFRTLADASASAIFIYQGIECCYANRAAEEITGYTREELLATSSWDLLHPVSREALIEQAWGRLQGRNGAQRFDIKILTKDGNPKWLDLTIGRIDLNGSPAALFTALDITERKLAEDEIRLQVQTDPLTGLANYRRLVEGFKAEVKRSRRTGRNFSLALFDLDNLKKINDIHGHLTGSRALCRLANVLRQQCRSIDLVARHGGDEFSVLLPETHAEGAEQFAQRVCERLSSDPEEPRLSASSGISVFSEDGETMEEIFSVADRAMYGKKEHGDGRLSILT